jgi:TPP-dependent pyruvate/acetoin dehydrogenase alpha subunit
VNDTRKLLNLYRSLRRIRRVEEEIARIYPSDKIKSPVHLSIGQEAVASGVCENLKLNDIVFGTYRGHAMYLAKGGDVPAMFAELYGKSGGCAKGRGGSMHLIDPSAGVMGTSAVVSTTIPNAIGYAYALKLQGKSSLVVSFFGDGATEEGVFYESLNFAALKKLPVLFVCENNGYAIHTHQKNRQAVTDICAKARACGVPAETIMANDVLKIDERSGVLIDEVRQGKGPRFLECMTYRWREHVGPGEDFGLGFRSKSEAVAWQSDDQMLRLGTMISADDRSRIDLEIEQSIIAAVKFAEESPFPDSSELFLGAYGERNE